MKSRAELEELLAAQRAQRRSVPPSRRRGRNLLGVFAVVFILLASGAAMYFAVQLTTPELTSTATASSSPVSSITNTLTTLMATPIVMRVCTDIPDGRLHVRFAVGDGSEVRGYLTENETVLPTSNTETVKGEIWQQITSPIAGWVNARYLCPSE